MDSAPISSQGPKAATVGGKVALSILLLCFMIPGLVGTVGVGRSAWPAAATWLWPKTPCEITEGTVIEVEDDAGEIGFAPVVAFRYEVDGAPHVSRVYRREGVTFARRAEAQQAVERFPVGRRAVCRVDPTSPGRAVLVTSSLGPVALLLVPVAFVVGPALVLKALWRPRPRGSGDRTPRSRSSQSRSWSTEPVLLPVGRSRPGQLSSATGGLGLQPRYGPVPRLLGVMLMALFWNGIVSVFVVNLVNEWRSGHWPIFTSLFLTPFVLVGLGLVGAVGYCLLACFNPRPRLELVGPALEVGGSTRLHWRLGSRSTQITVLSVTLEGREEATYTQGTDTKTDTAVFHQAAVLTVRTPWEVAEGEAIVTIPGDTMHSFAAEHNKVRWILVVHGEIPRWPDVKEEMEVAVAPRRAREVSA